MGFQIPDKAFLSFGRKQCVNALWRFALQIEQGLQKNKDQTSEITQLEKYLKVIQSHEQETIVSLAKNLIELLPLDENNIQKFCMILERENQIDLRDDEFLVTTIDTKEAKKEIPHEIYLVCDNLRSSFNVGSLFRSAEALGVKKIFLCGYSPTPENTKTSKSALGSDEWVEWEYFENTLECIDYLKKQGIDIYCLETAENSRPIKELIPNFPCAIVLGNERFGLGQSVLNRADEILNIDLFGRKNSLNVGVCGAIALSTIINNSQN